MAIPNIENNEQIVADYITSLELLDLKASTIEARIWSLVSFFKYVKFKPAEEVIQKDVESFAVHLRRCGKAKITQRRDLLNTRAFFMWLKPENDFFTAIKIRKEKPDNSTKEYVTSADVAALLPHCINQRDRALIFLMWESAARLGEILALNVGDVKPTKYGINIKVEGKTGKRDIMLLDSVPDIQLWMNLYKGNPEDPLFPIIGRSGKGRLAHRGAQTVLEKLVKKAGLTKRIYCHSFRHGRLTELSNLNMSEMQLRLYAGWTRESDMPAVYLHPDQKDIERKLLEIKGIVPEEEENIKEIQTTTRLCNRCQTANPFDSLYCRTCSMILDPVKAQEEKEKQFEEMRDYFEGIMNAAYDEVVKEEKPKTTKNKLVVSKK